MENYFIIHGSFGSPFGNWFSWLQDFISSDGKQVYVPQFPIGVDYQNYENDIEARNYSDENDDINENNVGNKNYQFPAFFYTDIKKDLM